MKHDDNKGGWYYTKEKTMIPQEEPIVKNFTKISFKWPEWAISQVNQYVRVNKISYSEAIKIVSKQLEEERKTNGLHIDGN